MDQYLKCTDTIDCDNETVKTKAQEIVQGLETDKGKVKALYYNNCSNCSSEDG